MYYFSTRFSIEYEQRKMWKLTRPDAIAVLNDEIAKKSLSRYFAVMQNQKPAIFMIAKKVPAEFDKNDPLETLWKEHVKGAEKFCKIEHEIRKDNLRELPTPAKSYFDLKIEIANRILQSCHFCSRRCGVNRLAGDRGYCRSGNTVAVSSIFAHLGEEPELVLSGTVFTMGCTKPTLNWIAENLGKETRVNLMFQYRPEWRAHEIPELHRHIRRDEMEKAVQIAEDAGLTNYIA